MNNDLIIKRGAANKIADEPVVDGALLLDKESGALYADIGNERLEVGAIAKNDAVFESNVTVQKNATIDGNADVKGAVIAASIVAKSDAELGNTSCTSLTANSATCTTLNSDNATCKNLTVSESMVVNAPSVTAKRIEGTSVNLTSEDNFLVNETSFKSLLLDAVYPIGSLYWTKDGNFNPNTSFGGYWVRIEGAFIFAAGEKDTVGNVIRGEKEHILKEEEMPSHWHPVVMQNTDGVSYPLTLFATTHEGGEKWGFYSYDTNRPMSEDYKYAKRDAYAASVGGDQPHNNMPPYLSRYCWERRESPVQDW